MRCQAGVGGRGGADLGNVDRPAGESRQDQAINQVMVRCESQRRLLCCHAVLDDLPRAKSARQKRKIDGPTLIRPGPSA